MCAAEQASARRMRARLVEAAAGRRRDGRDPGWRSAGNPSIIAAQQEIHCVPTAMRSKSPSPTRSPAALLHDATLRQRLVARGAPRSWSGSPRRSPPNASDALSRGSSLPVEVRTPPRCPKVGPFARRTGLFLPRNRRGIARLAHAAPVPHLLAHPASRWCAGRRTRPGRGAGAPRRTPPGRSYPFSFVAGAMAADADISRALAEGARDLGGRSGAKRVELKQLGDHHPLANGFERITRYTTFRVSTADASRRSGSASTGPAPSSGSRKGRRRGWWWWKGSPRPTGWRWRCSKRRSSGATASRRRRGASSSSWDGPV